jgi:glycosyltransferase involved in cell wall biosynthesis
MVGLMQKTDRPLRIDIVVHGRFHAFHLARALLARGHDVRLLTNYPKQIVARFGIPPQRVMSCLWHGLATRLYYRLRKKLGLPDWEPWFHRKFGSWASSRVRRDGDALYLFSGIAEETLRALDKGFNGIKLVVRASAHIRTQRALLAEEESRCGVSVDKPSDWIVAREEREYALADHIVVLSNFARDTFLEHGFPGDKILLLLSGVDASRFAPGNGVLEARIDRVRGGMPLRVLMVSTFSPRKGALDLLEIARALQGRMQFRFVGDVSEESVFLYRRAQGLIEFVPRLPEFELPQHYAWGDVFCFPTVEDGYPAVLAQALSAGLPVLTTPNCSAPDIVRDDANGWILPIRSPDKFIARLEWCDGNRDTLSEMIENMNQVSLARDWSKVAEHFERLIRAALEKRDMSVG